MDEFSLLEQFSELPTTQSSESLGTPCGLEGATPIAGVDAHSFEDAGLIVEVDGQLYDLGDDGGSVTLADDVGLSIYSDLDGDGTVDHVTTVRFDGTWESWISDEVGAAEDAAGLIEPVVPDVTDSSVREWDAYSWEESAHGRWH